MIDARTQASRKLSDLSESERATMLAVTMQDIKQNGDYPKRPGFKMTCTLRMGKKTE